MSDTTTEALEAFRNALCALLIDELLDGVYDVPGRVGEASVRREPATAASLAWTDCDLFGRYRR